MSFVLYADKNLLTVWTQEPITSGSVNVYPVQFKFSEDWEGLTRIAVFRAGVDTISVLLNENGECAIPWEILVKAGLRLNVGIYGTKGGDTVLPTVWADLGKILPGVTFGENARPPTPNPWDGTANHQHPIEAIIGLAEMLEQIPRPMTAAELQNILNGGDKVP